MNRQRTRPFFHRSVLCPGGVRPSDQSASVSNTAMRVLVHITMFQRRQRCLTEHISTKKLDPHVRGTLKAASLFRMASVGDDSFRGFSSGFIENDGMPMNWRIATFKAEC